MKFNLFGKKTTTATESFRVKAAREMIGHWRQMAAALESDLKRETGNGEELCDECCAQLISNTLDASAKVAELFAREAKVPPALVARELKKNLIENLLRARGGFSAMMGIVPEDEPKPTLN